MREELDRNAINKGKEIIGKDSKENKEDDSYRFNISDSILRINEIPSWKEQIQRVFKISVDQTENYLTIFFDELLLKGETVRTGNIHQNRGLPSPLPSPGKRQTPVNITFTGVLH